MNPTERITERVTRNGHPDADGTPTPLLTLPEFFDGNTVDGSIGCNLTPIPTPAEFRDVLEPVLARDDVADVRVQITMFDEPEWPFSDTVYVLTSASLDDVQGWFPEGLEPGDVREGWDDDMSFEPVEVPSGTRPVACWWD